jgi:hypothetical protein
MTTDEQIASLAPERIKKPHKTPITINLLFMIL